MVMGGERLVDGRLQQVARGGLGPAQVVLSTLRLHFVFLRGPGCVGQAWGRGLLGPAPGKYQREPGPRHQALGAHQLPGQPAGVQPCTMGSGF